MPANRAPNIDAPLTDAKTGNTNPQWWRFWTSIAAQFAGTAPPAMPVDAPGILSIANAQARPQGLTEAAVIEAAKQLIAAIPRGSNRDGATADLALAALRPNAPRTDTSASDLALEALRPPAQLRSNEALELATIALGRIQPAPRAPAPQILVCTQATFPTLAGNGATFVYVADFAHWIWFDGSVATFADGGSNYYVLAANAPSGIGWQEADGSTTHYLNADGSLSAKTLQDVKATHAYLKGGAGTDTLVAPVAPAISGHTETGTAVIGGTTDVDGGGGTALLFSVGVAGATVAAHTHTHGAGTLADSGHQHNLTSGNAPISTTGEPEAFYSRLWFRL